MPVRLSGLAAVLPVVMPGGKEPAVMAQPEYEPEPPVAATVVEYGLPVRPPGMDVVVMLMGGLTVMAKAAVAVWAYWSVTLTVKL